MKKEDYFDPKNEANDTLVKFKEVGDCVFGTYLGKRATQNKLSGKDQFLYKVKNDDGNITLFFGTQLIDSEMAYVKLYQKFGLKFVGTKPAKTPGMNPLKLFKRFVPKDGQGRAIMDEDAMVESAAEINPEEGSAGTIAPQTFDPVSDDDGDTGEISVDDIPMNPFGELTEGEKLSKIQHLGMEKFGLTDANAVAMEVMKATGKAFIPSNYDEILAFLQQK